MLLLPRQSLHDVKNIFLWIEALIDFYMNILHTRILLPTHMLTLMNRKSHTHTCVKSHTHVYTHTHTLMHDDGNRDHETILIDGCGR
jgi:hypothetical protein